MTAGHTDVGVVLPPHGEFLMAFVPTDFLFHFTVVSISALLLWLGVTGVDRWRIHWYRSAQSPKALFHELCRAHGLSRADRRCLASIIQDVASEECCRVFIDPHVIDEFCREHPDKADECQYLVHKLFGDPSK